MSRFLTFSPSWTAAAFFAIAVLTAGDAAGQTTNNIVANREYLSNATINATGDLLAFRADAGSCYCCEIISPAGESAFFNSATVNILPNVFGTPVPVTGRFAGGDNPALSVESARLCFSVPATIPFPQAELTLGTSDPSPPVTITANCEETTLFTGFNTSVTDFNFLEITNTLDAATTGGLTARDLTVTVTAINSVPNPDTTVINGEGFAVPAGSRTDVDIHSRSGTGAFGPVRLCHNGAPGSIKAVVSQYNQTSTVPFDFAPVAQDVAVTRGTLAGVSR